MKIPFTLEQFMDVFARYNTSVFPIQIAFYSAVVIAIYMLMRRSTSSNIVLSGLLSFLWLWMGIVYHIIFFSSINNAAYFFGTLYIIQGALFAWYGIKGKIAFRIPSTMHGVIGGIFVLFGVVVYPMIGYALSHVYPYAPTFGLPCPTTIFTFGVLLMSEKKTPIPILIIPFLWSLIGFSAAVMLGMYEDVALLITGVVATGMILLRNKRSSVSTGVAT